MIEKLVLVAFLLGHALVHLMFLTQQPPKTAGGPTWPFDLGRSWALSPLGLSSEVTRGIGVALIALLIGGYALAAIAALGIGPGGLWVPAIVVGAAASLALLGLFYQPWLTLGVVIDLALVWLVVGTGWAPEGVVR